MDPVRNPFNPGAGTPPPALTGRDDLLNDFRIALKRTKGGKPGKSVIPIGLRGVGKTVLLSRFRELALDDEFHVADMEAPDTGEFVGVLASKIRQTLLDLDRLGALSEKVKRALRILTSFSYTLPDRSVVALDLDPEKGMADSGRLPDDLGDLFTAVGEAAADRKTGVLISIDEIQYLNEKELASLITAVHKTTQRALPLMLVGAGLPQIPKLTGEARSYAERLFDFPEVGSLSREAARAALLEPANAEDVTFTAEALDAIFESTQGYPYFVQEWAYAVWNKARSSPITIDDVNAAAPAIGDRLDKNFFRVRFDRLTPAEKKYLRAMAELGPGPHRSADVANARKLGQRSVAPTRNNLIAKGMIYAPQHGETAFTVPLFDQFMRRAMPLEA